MKKESGIAFGQMVTVHGFLERTSQFGDGRATMKIWYRQAAPKPEKCVVISAVTLSDGESSRDYEEGFSYKPKTYFKAIKVGRRSGGTRYVLRDDIETDHLPFKGESITQ